MDSKRRTDLRGFAAALAAALAVSASAVAPAAADSNAKDDDWEHQFNGHEMWTSSLDTGLARAAKEKKPLLIDFYSHT